MRSVRIKSLGNEFIAPKTTSIGTGSVTCRARLGGLLKFYYREGAERDGRGFGHDLAAADFFTVEVLTMGGLVRYVIFFVMKLKTRAMEIAGITSQPDEAWMTQVARNLTDGRDGFLRGV